MGTTELSNFKLALLRAWLYAPTALVGATLMALAIKNVHPISEGLAYMICLFFATLIAMSKVKTLESKYGSAELLDKMNKFGGGLVLPVILKDAFNLFSGSHFDIWTTAAVDIGVPILFAPYSILFSHLKKIAEKVEVKP